MRIVAVSGAFPFLGRERPAQHCADPTSITYRRSLPCPFVERGEWDDDLGYPHAPMPAHERSWRHPSEIGATKWAVTEPPLVVGRGLSIATGTVGAALAVGLLWLMIPHHSRSGVAADASINSLRTSDSQGGGNGLLSSSPSLSSATVAPEPTTTAVFSSPTSAVGPTEIFSLPTMLIGRGGASAATPATAVALVPGHLVVTTSEAVRDRQSLEVLLPSGDIVIGAVVLIDDNSGTAVLSIPHEIEASIVQLSPDAGADSGWMMTGPGLTNVTMFADNEGVHVKYERDHEPGEGALVLDQRGRLLGMCSADSEGMSLISVDVMLEVLQRALTVAEPAWLGIQVGSDATGGITVALVMPNGPAATGGVLVGDAIVSVDGVEVATVEALGQALASRSAGDSITLGVVHAGSSKGVTTTVMLAAARPRSL